MGQRWNHHRDAKMRRKAQRLSGLPKSRIKRFFWRLHPKRLYAYWFSRDGGVMALKITGIAILVMFIFTLGTFAFFRKDLPDITDISGDNLGGSISYYDRTGKVLLWQDYNAVKRVPVASEEMSQHIKEATIATEDRNFYSEKGFSVRAIARAAINNTLKQGSTQGGSTITQQLVKITQDWTEERTFTRKIKELILAVELERTYTKDEILTGYLNAAPYGGVNHGVQAAASDYFHKSAKELSLAESAMMAVIPKAPGLYSPYSPYFDKAAFTARYNYVLDSMVDTGYISREDADKTKEIDITKQIKPQQTKYAGIRHPYFVLAAKNELTAKYFQDAEKGSVAASKVGGWKVITTLDVELRKRLRLD
jgi:membrane peptidoglycan carboxypeptidase